MTGEIEQHGMKAHRGALPLDHRAAEVVVEHGPHHALDVSEGKLMSAEKGLEARVESEADEDRPRKREHIHEGIEPALCPPDAQPPEVRPVDLRLLSWQHAQLEKRFPLGLRSHRGHQVAKLVRASRVAALHHHGVQTARRQSWVGPEHLLDERQVRIDHPPSSLLG